MENTLNPELALGFHSTDFPYERGPSSDTLLFGVFDSFVSIQLISPTRGDPQNFTVIYQHLPVRSGFHSTDFPYERGPNLPYP